MASSFGRRDFITLLGGATAGWPLVARAQQAGRLPTIGFLGPTTASGWSSWTAAFVLRLRELGWIEGRTVAIEYRWAEDRNERAVEIAAEFARLKVDVIFTSGAQNVVAAKQATAVIPIVFTAISDPVGAGLVASLGRPAGNVTGLSQMGTDLAGKRLEILHEMIPGLRRIAILANVGSPSTLLEIGDVQGAAGKLGLELAIFETRQPKDIASAFEAFGGRVEALHVLGNPLFATNRVRIITLATGAHLPTIFNIREYVEAGGLISYGPNFPDMFRRAGDYVDKILRGAKPSDLPVEQPVKFDLVVNLTTAKAIGLRIPESFLVRADEVIE